MAAYSEDLQVGPLRASTVADGKKLILYNRTEAFEPQNILQETSAGQRLLAPRFAAEHHR
jgi:hypothetical protein